MACFRCATVIAWSRIVMWPASQPEKPRGYPWVWCLHASCTQLWYSIEHHGSLLHLTPHWLFHHWYKQMQVSHRCHEDVNHVHELPLGELSLMSAVWSDFRARFLLSCVLAGCCSERARKIESEWREREKDQSFYASSLFPPQGDNPPSGSVAVAEMVFDVWEIIWHLQCTRCSLASYMKHSTWREKKVVILLDC